MCLIIEFGIKIGKENCDRCLNLCLIDTFYQGLTLNSGVKLKLCLYVPCGWSPFFFDCDYVVALILTL